MTVGELKNILIGRDDNLPIYLRSDSDYGTDYYEANDAIMETLVESKHDGLVPRKQTKSKDKEIIVFFIS